jgi:hypothetical protein
MTMKTSTQIKSKILELCSESEYGSWEFWSDRDNKTADECEQIFQALVSLVEEKMIVPTEHKYVKDQSYDEVSLDFARLADELTRSMTPYNVDPESFYWFYATDQGKEKDLSDRRAQSQ